MSADYLDKRYVAHFDMLGFKAATCRNPDEAWGALSDLENAMQVLKAKLLERSTNTVISDRLKAFIFSDSVLIFTLKDEREDLLAMLILICRFFVEAQSVCIPLRGGLAHGNFFFNLDKNLFSGIPFVRAYEICEGAQWTGVIVDDVIADHYETKLKPTNQGKPSMITKWSVPLKSGNVKESWVINWPKFSIFPSDLKPPVSPQQFYQAFARMFGNCKDLPNYVKAKYENTASFLNHQLLN